jgi:heme exporter protein B
MSAFITIVRHDLKLAFKKGSGTLNLLAFFVISASLFPFGIGSESGVLMDVGAGIIWVCALLASMLAIPNIFDEDYEDGSLAGLLLQGLLPEYIVLAKIASSWLISSIPLIIISPFLATLFHIEGKITQILLTLLIGTPTLCIIGTIGSALTLGLKKAGGLIGIIVLPLYIPVLIFGVGAVEAPQESFMSNILFLIGLFLLMLPVGVMAAAGAVKMALEE